MRETYVVTSMRNAGHILFVIGFLMTILAITGDAVNSLPSFLQSKTFCKAKSYCGAGTAGEGLSKWRVKPRPVTQLFNEEFHTTGKALQPGILDLY